MRHPYSGLPDQCFWSSAMSNLAPWQIDPVARAGLIEPGHKVATMGSCFAQHLARHIQVSGLTFFETELPARDMDEGQAKRMGYGVYSARYGNIYTVRQGVQLFDRAFGRFDPQDRIWEKGDSFVDAFRPRIQEGGFSSEAAVRAAEAEHLGCVRRMFEEADWLIFTLGLTEAWRSRTDDAVYPGAPGVVGGHFDPQAYEFVNFTVDEVRSDLRGLIARARAVNPNLRVLLTVSPVPLIATYENRHVWVSTTRSKAILVTAAAEVEQTHEDVFYFPSYEIITSPAAGGRYYEDDLRRVSVLGVQHVMRVFEQHFFRHVSDRAAVTEPLVSERDDDVVCDEEVIGEALRGSRL